MALTTADADRLERGLAEASYWRGAELQHVHGNPLAIDNRSFGRVHARRVDRHLGYYGYFSGPMRVQTGDDSIVPDLTAWYAQTGAPCFVRLSPLFSTDVLQQTLTSAGFAQTFVLSLLYGTPSLGAVIPIDQVSVVEVGPDQDQTFLDLWTDGAPEDERQLRHQLARAEFAHWRRYVAFLDGQPAAHAALFTSTETRTAVLAATGTLPALRGRGCQTALVHRRMSDAAIANCDLVAVETSPGSASQRNLERLGFQLAVTRAVWELAPRAPDTIGRRYRRR